MHLLSKSLYCMLFTHFESYSRPNATQNKKNLVHCARKKENIMSPAVAFFGPALHRNTMPVGHKT